MRRIKDLRCELKRETGNAEQREEETNETESVVLPECKKVCAESMLAPAHARKNWTRRQRFCEEKRRDWRR